MDPDARQWGQDKAIMEEANPLLKVSLYKAGHYLNCHTCACVAK
jgi:hypothetical protein